MYSIESYGNMISDQLRMEAYYKAMQQTIRPGDVVVDIGTGTGIHALLACQLGASRVYAIEPAKAIHLAQEIAQANGYSDRIHFIKGFSTEITLPELADVVVSDLHGIMPWFYQHIPSLMDARQRFLKPGGSLLPLEDQLWGGVVEAENLYDSYLRPWNEAPYGLNFEAGLKIMTNTWGRGRVRQNQFLTKPQQWTQVNYTTIDTPNLNVELQWTVTQPGKGHGLMLWFDTTVAAGVQITSAPYAPEIAYGSAFFPWTEPVLLEVGDQIHVHLRADLTGQDYTWTWETKILNPRPSSHYRRHFRQSTFFTELLSLMKLGKRSSKHKPRINKQGQADLFILQQMNGATSLEEISALAHKKFPEQFSTTQKSLQHVREISELYSDLEFPLSESLPGQ